jgi:hypothetical protein
MMPPEPGMDALLDLATIEHFRHVGAGRFADHARIVVRRRRRSVCKHGDAMQLAIRHTQIDAVDAKRLADLVLQELGDRAAVDSPQDLAVDVAEVE